jgi:nicotinate-nucleotide--dimethylbenzimidazole phosphoribosyltransferase
LQRDALYAVIAARRDVRRFRPDPIPAETLERVLTAAHQAPSVGHSQPWRFVVVRDADVRQRAALMADRQRLAQAGVMDPDAARRLLDLQLEGIREAPLAVVVCCDRRAQAAGVLGRATFPDADVWSCACAIENMWLAARAEGLGLGWVTLFDPVELAALLHLPDGVVTLGWLCLGWPDERPPGPGLQRAGWSRRLALSQVVIEEHWPAAGNAPAAPASHLRSPDQNAVVAARDDADRLLTPPGSLGVLDRVLDKVVALGHSELPAGTMLLVAADHPVARHRVSAYPVEVTGQVLAAAAAGKAMGAVAARAAGLALELLDAGVNAAPMDGVPILRCLDPRGDLVETDAMSSRDAERLLEGGRRIGERLGAGVLVALGEVGVANTTVAAALAAALLDADPEMVVGLGAGADTAMLDRKRATVGYALRRTCAARRSALRDPLVALAALGGPEFAVLTGVVLGAAGARAVVILDGLATSIAALLAVQIEPAAVSCLIAGQRSRERAHELVLTQLGCEPLVDLRLRAGEGVGASLATTILRQGLTTRAATARVNY